MPWSVLQPSQVTLRIKLAGAFVRGSAIAGFHTAPITSPEVPELLQSMDDIQRAGTTSC
jgi:hypothetical protein